MDVPEREWLEAGFFWIALALLCAAPWIGPSPVGRAARLLICGTVLVHIGESLYGVILARRANLDPLRWGVRSLFLGYLAVRRLRQIVSSGAQPS